MSYELIVSDHWLVLGCMESLRMCSSSDSKKRDGLIIFLLRFFLPAICDFMVMHAFLGCWATIKPTEKKGEKKRLEQNTINSKKTYLSKRWPNSVKPDFNLYPNLSILVSIGRAYIWPNCVSKVCVRASGPTRCYVWRWALLVLPVGITNITFPERVLRISGWWLSPTHRAKQISSSGAEWVCEGQGEQEDVSAAVYTIPTVYRHHGVVREYHADASSVITETRRKSCARNSIEWYKATIWYKVDKHLKACSRHIWLVLRTDCHLLWYCL